MMNDAAIPFASIDEIGARYRTRELSPVAVTELTLARIEALNPRLNAFITVTADQALAAARRVEEDFQRSSPCGRLHGIPVALKDLVATAGIRTTAGSPILASHLPTTNADIVRYLNTEGAVLVGKTNLLEFAYGIVHPDYGPTWNPWDPTRTAGGSNGGSAAAVATDTGVWRANCASGHRRRVAVVWVKSGATIQC